MARRTGKEKETMRAEDVIEQLQLIPHPDEGGFYRELYRSEISLAAEALPAVFTTARSACTAIYYLMTPTQYSALHRLRSDEIWHFYLGDPIEQFHLYPDGRTELVHMGTDLEKGQRPQVLIPAEVWQTARLAPGGSFALVGATVAPGFEFADYEGGDEAALRQASPALDEWLSRFPARA
jgi:uncharacterized protein